MESRACSSRPSAASSSTPPRRSTRQADPPPALHDRARARPLGLPLPRRQGAAPAAGVLPSGDIAHDVRSALEREANVFAAELLMPEAAVRAVWSALADVPLWRSGSAFRPSRRGGAFTGSGLPRRRRMMAHMLGRWAVAESRGSGSSRRPATSGSANDSPRSCADSLPGLTKSDQTKSDQEGCSNRVGTPRWQREVTCSPASSEPLSHSHSRMLRLTAGTVAHTDTQRAPPLP